MRHHMYVYTIAEYEELVMGSLTKVIKIKLDKFL